MNSQLTNFLNLFNNPAFMAGYVVLIVWSLIWKGIALWKAARNNQRNWFVALLVINTVGILEIIYIFYFSKLKNNILPSDQVK
jgi:hypothetical protein